MTLKSSLSVFNYFPLEFMGGGEVTAINIFNKIQDVYKIHYYSSKEYTGIKRVSHEDLNKLIEFEYRYENFRWFTFLRLRPLFKPEPDPSKLRFSSVSVIFLSSVPSKSFLKCVIKQGKTVVYLFHGMTFEGFRGRSISGFFLWMYGIVAKIFLLYEAQYIKKDNFVFQVFNQSQLSELKKIGVKDDNIFFIPSGIDFEPYKLKENDEMFNIVVLTRIEKMTKGIDNLLKLIRKFPKNYNNIKFIIIGSGRSSITVKKLSLQYNFVQYKGFVGNEEKYKILSESNLMISLSNIEPFPLNILEGLAAGLPIVCTNFSGSWAIKQDERLGKVTSFRPKEIIASILFYYDKWRENKGQYYSEKLSRRKIASQTYSTESMIDKYREMLEYVCNRKKTNNSDSKGPQNS